MLPELQHKIITAVLAQNPETGEIAYKEVLDTFRNETNVVVHVTVNDETFTCTEEHPFYVEGKGWVNAGALHAGMVVWLADGTKAIIEDVTIEYLDTPIAVYNFKVEDFHTYFVGYSGVLVHNANCGNQTISTSNTAAGDSETFAAPDITINSRGELTNGLYTLDAPGMVKHVDGKNPTKGQFLYDVDANKAVLDAAAYADANDLWVPSSGNPADFANKAKVNVINGPVGVTGSGELTDVINVYRTKTGFVHGTPGNP